MWVYSTRKNPVIVCLRLLQLGGLVLINYINVKLE